MAGPSPMLGTSASATPTNNPKSFISQASQANANPSRPSLERDALQPPQAAPNGGGASYRSNLAPSALGSFAPRGSSLNPPQAPGSFSSELRSQAGISRIASRVDAYGIADSTRLDRLDEDGDAWNEKTLAALKEALKREVKIKEGSENMLEALNSKKAKQARDQRLRVEAELKASSQRIRDLHEKIAEAEQMRTGPLTPSRQRPDVFFQSSSGLRSPRSPSRSGAGSDFDEPTESPTFALAEILQSLEVDGMNPAYYVARANNLVDLFKRHPALKYDLVWSVFGVRMQAMLLSDSREVVAAGYRMMRYAISDVSSLKKIRTLNTDYIVVHSLVKDRKADLEREQALKFVRAFLDVKNGVCEISRAIVRTIVSVADQPEDKLRSICIETLAEILVKDPRLLISCGGISSLSEAMSDGSYKAPESLANVLLYLLDSPHKRKYLRPGYSLEILFTVFTDQYVSNEKILRQNSKAIATAIKSWSGLLALSMYDFRAVRSLIGSLLLPCEPIREAVVELLYSLLRIKSPAWASSFLAGRRLTTYGRVANLNSAAPAKGTAAGYVEDDSGEQNFVEHYTALLLAVFVKNGLLTALLRLIKDAENATLKRKATLLIGEVLRLSSRLLPLEWSSELQLLPELFTAATRFGEEDRFIATGIVYQISSISKTLHRSSPTTWSSSVPTNMDMALAAEEQPRGSAATNLDDASFRQLLIESAVLSHSNYNKWRWDIVLKIIEGPLTSGKRLEEALKASKFVKRVVNFYRPFKYKFSDVPNTRNTQRYIRTGCALMHTLLQTPEGVRYLMDSKLLRQIAECLAQCDPASGISAQFIVFSKDSLSNTLRGGYITMLGVLSGDPKGLQMLDRWRIFNMMYHIISLNQRPDLIKLLLSNLDYSLQGHPRVMLSKALTAGSKDTRIHATNILRQYTAPPKSSAIYSQQLSQPMQDSKWAIQLLVTQLYDPDVEVCSTAVKILEKACNTKEHLEYLVECRPALDHLGEIGAPLLLRFLSSSIGYHYLDGLDYISNEMDDWFLGRNDSYVALIEASLGRAFLESADDQTGRMSVLGEADAYSDAHIPPHFYRELTRTREGCKLLADKGHFNEFVSTIHDYGMLSDDTELMIKVKGCLWAVGNVGSMELGAPFLESCDVVQDIVRIAQEHEVMSLRGTAFFVLGLISRSIHGLEILSEQGWVSNTNAMGASLGFCLPKDLTKFFSVKPWQHEKPTSIVLLSTQKTLAAEPPVIATRPRSESLMSAIGSEAEQEARVELDPDPTNQRILELVMELGNVVLWKKSMQSLHQLRYQKKAPGFRQPRLFLKVMSLLENHHYKLQARAVVDLFDKDVLRRVVFEEDEADEDKGGDGTIEDDEDEEEEDEDDDDSVEESSGDEQRTERQRSVSDPSVPAGQ